MTYCPNCHEYDPDVEQNDDEQTCLECGTTFENWEWYHTDCGREDCEIVSQHTHLSDLIVHLIELEIEMGDIPVKRGDGGTVEAVTEIRNHEDSILLL